MFSQHLQLSCSTISRLKQTLKRRSHGPFHFVLICSHPLGGAHPKKTKKTTSRYTKIGKLALVFFWFFLVFFGFLKFPNWHWFFLVFLVFFGFFWFFWHWFWPEFEIANCFFWLLLPDARSLARDLELELLYLTGLTLFISLLDWLALCFTKAFS